MKNKKTKLLYSVLSLLLCLSMLLGSTFAWFTDSVHSGINVIAAGNLDVALYHSNAAVQDEKVDETTELFMDLNGKDILWEPGVVSYENLRVANEGDLALAYQMAINTANENFVLDPSGNRYGLSQVLKVGLVEGGITATDRAGVVASVEAGSWLTLSSFRVNGSLLPAGAGESEKTWGIVIYWEPSDIDNLWNLNNGKQLDQGEVLSIDLGIQLLATQEVYESDAFGSDYDASAKQDSFPDFVGGSASATVVPNGQNQINAGVKMSAGKVTATVPAGAQVVPGTNQLTLTVTEMGASGANIQLSENEKMRSLDVHIDGIAAENTTPITVELKEVAPIGLNMGNYKLYHVEADGTKEMTLVAAAEDFTAHNQFKYDPATGDIVLYMATFSEVSMVADLTHPWKGGVDHSWYVGKTSPYTIANADQLWSFSQIAGGMNGQTQDSFAGKTVKLIADINLGDKESENNPDIIFYPIGYYNSEGTYERSKKAVTSGLRTFEGTFDGQGHTIANFYHNTWEMKGDHNWYSPEEQYYRDGMGLFGRVYGGTVKNLTVSNFSSDGEIATTGCIAAYADGATFENIAIFNCNPRVYNIGNGGIVGCVGWYAKEADLKTTFKNITVDNSNKISALWGSYDVACGGIVGQYYPTSGQSSANYPVNAGIHFENCHISAIMDVYNDVCANYQYYAYRYAGMIIGSIRENTTNEDGKTIPNMTGISATGCTVNYGDWNDYYYCEFEKNGHPSYSGPSDYKFSRVPDSELNFTDSNSNGKVDANERASVTGCKHNHTDAENNRAIYLPFHQLFTGYGWGVSSIGLEQYSGIVTDLGITEGDQEASVEKFTIKLTTDSPALKANVPIFVGDLFAAIDGAKINTEAVQVSVSALGDSKITATYVPNEEDWTEGTLTFDSVEGLCSVTIQDYQFCKPTSILLKDGAFVKEVEKFGIVFPNVDKYLYRVGNLNEISLASLFTETGEAPVNDKTVSVKVTNGTGDELENVFEPNTSNWEQGKLKFSEDFTGIVKVVISEEEAFEKTLNLEVVEAKNATGAMNTYTKDAQGIITDKFNVVLLNDCDFGSLEVAYGYSFYGNGFTMTCSADSYAVDSSYGFVTLNNGTLDNVQIKVPNFSHSNLYDSNKKEDNTPPYTNAEGTRTWYYNIRSAVVMNGDSTLINSYVSGGRAAVYVASGIAAIDNCTIVGGAAANIDIAVVNSVLLKDLTLIQKPTKATVNDKSKTLMGFSGVIRCDGDGSTADIQLEGNLRQYAWIDDSDVQYVPSTAEGIVGEALKKTEFLHDIDGDGVKESLNLGFVYIPKERNGSIQATIHTYDNRTNKNVAPYDYANIETAIATAKVYSYKNPGTTAEDYLKEPGYKPNGQGATAPTVSYNGNMTGGKFETGYDDANGWNSVLTVDLDTVGAYMFSFENLIAKKFGQELEYTVKDVEGNTVNKNTPIELTGSAEHKYTLSIVDNLLFDAEGNQIKGKSIIHEYSFTLTATMSKINPPVLTIGSADILPIATNYKDDDWTIAVPALENISVTYWSTTEKRYKENVPLKSLIDWTAITPGKQNATGANKNIWTYEGADFTLQITGGTVKSSPTVYTIPVVVTRNSEKQLYFVASNSSDGMVSNSSTGRDTNLSFVFIDKNQAQGAGTRSWSIKYADSIKGKAQYNYDKFCDGTLTEVTSTKPTTCLAEGMRITMADGSKKAVEDMRKGDLVMSFDHMTGELTFREVIIVVKTAEDNYYKNTFVFDDGTELATINEHGIFDLDLNKYVNIDHLNYQEFIGHSFVSVDTNGKIGVKKLVAVETVQESGYKYDIVTDGTLNYVAEDTLSVTHVLVDVINSFDFGENLKYNKLKMLFDMARYGLYTYDEWEEYCDISVFEQYNIPVMKVGISKGLYTKEYIVGLINTYVLDESVQIIN